MASANIPTRKQGKKFEHKKKINKFTKQFAKGVFIELKS